MPVYISCDYRFFKLSQIAFDKNRKNLQNIFTENVNRTIIFSDIFNKEIDKERRNDI